MFGHNYQLECRRQFDRRDPFLWYGESSAQGNWFPVRNTNDINRYNQRSMIGHLTPFSCHNTLFNKVLRSRVYHYLRASMSTIIRGYSRTNNHTRPPVWQTTPVKHVCCRPGPLFRLKFYSASRSISAESEIKFRFPEKQLARSQEFESEPVTKELSLNWR